MYRKTVSIVKWALLLASLLVLAAKIQPARASGTVYIMADGSIMPSAVPISITGNATYNLTGDIDDSIVIERDNIVLDGSGYTVQGRKGASGSTGICLLGTNNVTIRNTQIQGFYFGIFVTGESSSYNIISGNNIIGNSQYGIWFDEVYDNNIVSGNNITNNPYGICLRHTTTCDICLNSISANGAGIWCDYSSSNNISKNNIAMNNGNGILFADYDTTYKSTHYSSDNIVCENNITNNSQSIGGLGWGENGNVFYHNNFVSNSNNKYDDMASISIWDNGYPSGGNYWDSYSGADIYSGVYQNESGADGIGDTPYGVDNYPLVKMWSAPNIATNLTFSKTVVGQGDSVPLNVTSRNLGNKVESFSTTLCANETILDSQYVMLMMGKSIESSYLWNTTNCAYGDYIISTNILEKETSIARVTVTISGDIDGNLKVTLADLVGLAHAYSSKPGDTNWNPNADIDGNVKVGLSDLVILAEHYGQHYS